MPTNYLCTFRSEHEASDLRVYEGGPMLTRGPSMVPTTHRHRPSRQEAWREVTPHARTGLPGTRSWQILGRAELQVAKVLHGVGTRVISLLSAHSIDAPFPLALGPLLGSLGRCVSFFPTIVALVWKVLRVLLTPGLPDVLVGLDATDLITQLLDPGSNTWPLNEPRRFFGRERCDDESGPGIFEMSHEILDLGDLEDDLRDPCGADLRAEISRDRTLDENVHIRFIRIVINAVVIINFLRRAR